MYGELCDPDFRFIGAVDACLLCIYESGKLEKGQAPYDLLEADFQSAVDFCMIDNDRPLPTGIDPREGIISSSQSSRPSSSSTSTRASMTPITTLLETTTSATTASETTAPDTNSDLDADTSSTSPQSSTNRAWIAGPVVGGILGLALLLILALFCYRRQTRRSDDAKAGSPSEVAFAELDPKDVKFELGSQGSPDSANKTLRGATAPVEMPANEPAGQEMDGLVMVEKGESDSPNVKRKALPVAQC